MPSFAWRTDVCSRSEEHTSELQSLTNLVCRLLLENKHPVIDQPQGGKSGRRSLGVRRVGHSPADALEKRKVLHAKRRRSGTLHACWFFFLMDTAPPETYSLPPTGAPVT